MAVNEEQVEMLLRRRGVLTGAQIADALGTSQPTVSRLLAKLDSRIVRIGRARATRYALVRTVGRAGSRWPIYRINESARAEHVGELTSLYGGEFFFEASGNRPVFNHGEFKSGIFPGLPWFIDDQRPQGFLGRAFGRRIAEETGANPDISLWSADDVVLALLSQGEDMPGDLVFGEESLRRALRATLGAESMDEGERRERYPMLADAALRGEVVGSSAGGEQPKFTVNVARSDRVAPMIVKFSERSTSAAGRRWSDLLVAEHLASVVLREHALPAAESEILEADQRVFHQSTRFDRTAEGGRRGLVSLTALDAAHYGHGRLDWWRYAPILSEDGWLSLEDAGKLRKIAWFGMLIANNDMHLGNAALELRDQRPLPLLPVFDMLPMTFRPATNGEVVERSYDIPLPLPEEREDWLSAAEMADPYWGRIIDDGRVSAEFKEIAQRMREQLRRAVARIA